MGLSSEVDEGWVGGSWRGEMGGKGGGGGMRGGGRTSCFHTPSIAFRHLPGCRKPVLGV